MMATGPSRIEGISRLQVEDVGDTAAADTARALLGRCSPATGLVGNTLGPTLPSTELSKRYYVDSCSEGGYV